jgi:hypothetical protein
MVTYLMMLYSLKPITELPLVVIERLVSNSKMTALFHCINARYFTVSILHRSVRTRDLCSAQPNCQVSCSEISVLVRSGE